MDRPDFGTFAAAPRNPRVMGSNRDPNWFADLISRCALITRWVQALDRQADGVKLVIDFTL